MAFEQRWSLWGSTYGGANRTNGDPNMVGSHDLSARTGGFAAGAYYQVSPFTMLGFALEPLALLRDLARRGRVGHHEERVARFGHAFEPQDLDRG